MATSFLKKEEAPKSNLTREELEAQKPIFDAKHKVYFVNNLKHRRAQRILGLINGTIPPQKAEDVEARDHYKAQLARHEVDPKGDTALPALYEILGGLIRSAEEQKKADARAQEARAKAKKRLVE